MDEDRRRRFANYLDQHPAAAEQLRKSLSHMLSQYQVADGLMAAASREIATASEGLLAAVSKIKLPDFSSLIREQIEDISPRNWPRPLPAISQMEEVLEADGIPIVHIPRAEIVQEILDAATYYDRIKVIEHRSDDIAQDCRDALSRDFHHLLEKHAPLARRAVDAYVDGHHEAAQALAVSVCDTYLKKLFQHTSYKKMIEKVAIDQSDDSSVGWAFNVHYALAPGVSFLATWTPGDGEEPPTRLSRHVSIHNATTDQMTELNSTIAIMLATSITIAIDYAAVKGASD